MHSLTFDAPTNRADMFGVEPCSAVLDAQSLAMLQGEDEDEPECVWNSESELQARATVLLGHPLHPQLLPASHSPPPAELCRRTPPPPPP